MRARLAAHYWIFSAVVAILLGAVAYGSRATWIPLPLLQDVVPARSVVAVVAATLLITPLYGAFGPLSRTLVREPLMRPLRAVGVALLNVVATSPSWIGIRVDERALLDARMHGLLLFLAVAAVVVLGDFAWLVPLALGFGTIVIISAPMSEIGRRLSEVPLWLCLAAPLVAFAAYSFRGARS